MKIVINKCYGGFGISEKGIRRYAQLKNLPVYVKDEGICKMYYSVPLDQVDKLHDEGRASGNYKEYNAACIDRNISRDDPLLVQVVEELGAAANGGYAKLSVVEIPDDVDWEIDEYDGMEWVAERHRTWS